MSNFTEWAERELVRAGYTPNGDADDPNTWMYDHIMKLLRVFTDEGHSGSSARWANTSAALHSR